MDMPDLGHDVGPFPLGVWVAIAGAGIGIAWWARSRGSSAAPTTTATDALTAAHATPTQGAVVTLPGTSSIGTPDIGQYDSNEQWASVVERELIARGYQPGLVVTALANYLYGQPLTSSEQAMVEVALARYGPPPFAPALLPSGTDTVPPILPPQGAPSSPAGASPGAGGPIIPQALPQRVGPSGEVMPMPTGAQQTAGSGAQPIAGTGLPAGVVVSPASSYDWLPPGGFAMAPGGGTGIDTRYPVSII